MTTCKKCLKLQQDKVCQVCADCHSTHSLKESGDWEKELKSLLEKWLFDSSNRSEKAIEQFILSEKQKSREEGMKEAAEIATEAEYIGENDVMYKMGFIKGKFAAAIEINKAVADLELKIKKI